MAAARRSRPSMTVELPSSSLLPTDIPLLSAIFFIYFDQKIGYTIGWKRSLPGIELEGVVEYKSLPSGLHLVTEDLIYYVHERHAGLSAFVNSPADSESRNAQMIAVGILVPLSYGRLGRSWKHAEALKELAQKLAIDTSKTELLEDYWNRHKAQDAEASLPDSPVESPAELHFKPIRSLPGKVKAHARNRSASDGQVLLRNGQQLSEHHPALNLPDMLDMFGPLIFPIHRAALLRKRILLSGHAPVNQICDFVYNLSILSNLPIALSQLLPSTAPPQRLRPLFSIGVHDIPFLEEDLRASKDQSLAEADQDESANENGWGWVACTTDGILSTKTKLYDILITLPPSYAKDAKDKSWPKVETSRGTEIKATQRDLRRYKTLRAGLARMQHRVEDQSTPPAGSSDVPRPKSQSHSQETENYVTDTDPIVEPVSWSALAYSGFMWWASAGEQRHILDSELAADVALLADLEMDSTPQTPRMRPRAQSNTNVRPAPVQVELSIIAYFHRLTTLLLGSLSDVVDAMSSDDEDEGQSDDSALLQRRGYSSPDWDDDSSQDERGPAVYISRDDITHMGLDVWSTVDHSFLNELSRVYFGRRAVIEGQNVDVCGIRIC